MQTKNNQKNTVKKTLVGLLLAGGVVATWPVSGGILFGAMMSYGVVLKMQEEEKWRLRKEQKMFYYLKNKKYIKIEHIGKNKGRVTLTNKGRDKAEKYRLMNLPKLKRPRRWDGQWRLVIYDIASEKREKRFAIRIALRNCGAVLLQKSVWVVPFDCTEQVSELRHILRLSEEELRIITAFDLGGDDRELRKHFKL